MLLLRLDDAVDEHAVEVEAAHAIPAIEHARGHLAQHVERRAAR